MKEYQVPKIAFKLFIKPYNKNSSHEYADHCANTLLIMVKRKYDAGDQTADNETIFTARRHRFYTGENKPAINDLFKRDHQKTGYGK